MKQVSARVIENSQLLPEFKRSRGRNVSGSRIVWLNCPEIAREARPGQFVMVRCGEKLILPRPFSIHRINDRGDMALFYAVWEDGKGTRWLSQRKAGDNIDLFGPLGNGFAINPASRNLLLVAGGIGVAPLYSLAQEAINKGHSVRLLLGAATASQIYPWRELPKGIDRHLFTEDGTEGEPGMVTRHLPAHIDWADQVFACGPMPMYRDMTNYPQLKHKPVQISLEMRMGCGLGVCYGCTVKTKNGLKQVCKDGPVFDLEDILWNELVQV